MVKPNIFELVFLIVHRVVKPTWFLFILQSGTFYGGRLFRAHEAGTDVPDHQNHV